MKINVESRFHLVLICHSLIFAALFSCSIGEKKSPNEIAELLNSSGDDAIIIDLRDLTEYSKGHIKGAVNIPFRKETFADRISVFENNQKTAFFYCGQGIKTGEAEAFVGKSSFKKIYIMEGGFMAWKQQGLEIAQ